MSASLVGSEMCIRDSFNPPPPPPSRRSRAELPPPPPALGTPTPTGDDAPPRKMGGVRRARVSPARSVFLAGRRP
eukprot:4580306-Alexandrium_andersonii.AAC.1